MTGPPLGPPPAPPPTGSLLFREWSRLHPLSPVVRFFAGMGIAAFFWLSGLGEGRRGEGTIRLIVFGSLLLLTGLGGFLEWLVTRWRVQGSDLQIESGLIRRQSVRIPLSRIQAVDVVLPLAARILGLAEVRVVSAGRGGEKGRLAYLTQGQASTVRAQLLALAHGLDAETPEPPAFGLFHVDNGRLFGSILLRGPTLLSAFVLLLPALILTFTARNTLAAATGVLPAALVVVVDVARSFNAEYDFSIGEAPDGLRVHRGLLQQRNETIPYGRIQAIRFVQPLLWRPFGWYRLEVDVARQHDPQRERAEARQLSRALVPVGSEAEAAWLMSRVMPGATLVPPSGSAPPPRAKWRVPLSYHYLRVWHDPWYVVARTGRVRPATVVVPLEKIQSVRLTTGPVMRALRLGSVHVDTAGRRWHASAPARDEPEASHLFEALGALARQARRLRAASQTAVPGAKIVDR